MLHGDRDIAGLSQKAEQILGAVAIAAEAVREEHNWTGARSVRWHIHLIGNHATGAVGVRPVAVDRVDVEAGVGAGWHEGEQGEGEGCEEADHEGSERWFRQSRWWPACADRDNLRTETLVRAISVA